MTSENVAEPKTAEAAAAAPAKTVDDQLIDELVGRAQAEGLQLTGEGGPLQQLTKRLLESALDGEITDHLGYDKHDPAVTNGGNSRNGTRAKTVLTDVGPVGIAVPRDREGSFAARSSRSGRSACPAWTRWSSRDPPTRASAVQGSAAVVEVDRPQHVFVEGQDVPDQFQQGRFVVQDPAGQQPFAVRVDHHAVVVFLADVHSGPYPGHGHLRQLVARSRPSRRPRRRCPTQRSSRISQLAVESSRGSGRPSLSSHRTAIRMTAIPRAPGSRRSYE